MVYQIDQSGKIEDTAKDTVLAYSNGRTYSVLVKKRTKRKLQELFRLHGMTRVFIYVVFSVGIFYLLRGLKSASEVIIDVEYPGRDILITELVEIFLESHKSKLHKIRFGRIGKHPNVHYAAKDVFDKKVNPDHVLTEKDVIRAIKKADGRLRGCLSTLVDARPRPFDYLYSKKAEKSRRK